MCNRCSNKFNPLTQQQAYMKNMQNAQTANMIIGGASMMLNMIFGGFASANSVSSYSNTTTPKSLTEKYSKGSTTVENTEEIENNQEQSKADIEKEVNDILTKNSLTVSINTLKAIIEKYPTMKAIQTGGLSVEQRVINYAKGLEYDKVMDSFVNAKLDKTTSNEIYTIEQGTGNDEVTKVKNGFLQSAQEQIELYDNQIADGKINFTEFFNKELAGAQISADELSEEKYNEAMATSNALFKALDVNDDSYLDKEEMASLSWVQSTINLSDTNVNTNNSYNDITFEEWDKVNELFNTYKEVVFKKLPSDKQTEFKNLQHDRSKALNFLKEHSTATEEEITKIADFFNRYDKSYVGFKEFTLNS